MTDTVDVPVAGRMNKKVVIGGLVIVAGVVGYAYLKRAMVPAEPEVIDPELESYSGGLQTYGSGSTTGGLAYNNPPPADVDPDDLPPTNNAQWVQRGVDYMQGLAFDAQFVATTLGKYLARVPVIASEADVIRTVEGAIGRPPVGEYRIIMVSTPPPPPPANDPPPPPPPAQQPPPAVPEKVSVPLNVNLYTWTAEIAAAYRIPYDLNRMRSLNPGIDGYIKWLDTKPDKTPIFYKGTPPVRLR